MAAAKRVLRYLCSTSGMGLVLGGRSPVVLTGHADASWADDQATQRSSQGYTFSLGSGSVSWRATLSSSVLGSSCEAEIYTGAMAAQELRWLTYLLTDLGEPPRSPPVLYVDNKAMLALCREQRLEHRTKHIALCYFLARELQQRGQLRLAYVASEANTADVFTKALAPCDHQRFCTQLGLVMKSSRKRKADQLQPIPSPERAWQQVTMDFVTMLSSNPGGNDAVMVVVDTLTKMAHFAACKKSISAEETARLFIAIVVRLHGIPATIISDRDTKFTSNFWKNLWEQFGTRLLFSSSYHPDTNGQTERTNQMMEQLIRATCDDPTTWEQQLPLIDFAYNKATSATTQQSLFYLNYRQNPTVPLTPSQDNPTPRAHQFAEILQDARTRATEAIKKANVIAKRNDDRHRRQVTYHRVALLHAHRIAACALPCGARTEPPCCPHRPVARHPAGSHTAAHTALPATPRCASPCCPHSPAAHRPAARAALWLPALLHTHRPASSRTAARAALLLPALLCAALLAAALPCPGCAPLFPSRAPPLPALRASLVLARRLACVLPCCSRAALICPLWLLSVYSHSIMRAIRPSLWLTRDAAARLAVRNHLPLAERAHFGQHKSAKALYNAVVARYSSPATNALGRLILPYHFPMLSALATVEDLVTHLRTSDTRYRAALPAEFLAEFLVDELATPRSSQGYTFSLGSGSVSWRSTRSSSVLSSSCEAKIYAGAMAVQELRWLTYLLTGLGERPRSPPVVYVDNKTMIALCQEHRLEHRMKHIALRYFLARELQQRGQLCLAYVATRAKTADIFTKALQSERRSRVQIPVYALRASQCGGVSEVHW
ncbi:unnamed protein product [Closterium sp. NIES-54]